MAEQPLTPLQNDRIRSLVRELLVRHETQTKVAAQLGVTGAALSQFLSGKAGASTALASRVITLSGRHFVDVMGSDNEKIIHDWIMGQTREAISLSTYAHRALADDIGNKEQPIVIQRDLRMVEAAATQLFLSYKTSVSLALPVLELSVHREVAHDIETGEDSADLAKLEQSGPGESVAMLEGIQDRDLRDRVTRLLVILLQIAERAGGHAKGRGIAWDVVVIAAEDVAIRVRSMRTELERMAKMENPPS